MTYGRTYSEQRFGPLAQITADNANLLGLAWYADFDIDRGQEATPLIIDGVMYASTAWSNVRAFDAKTGKPLWFYDAKVPRRLGVRGCCDVVNRGVAAWKGKIFVATFDGRLVAIVADDGAGGAQPRAGGGLEGIERRLKAFDGMVAVTSPPGGPTQVTMELPCALSLART